MSEMIESNQVLIVDDDKYIRDSLSDFLRKIGLTVACRANAFDALDYIAKQPPQLAMIDIKMPGMDGLSLLNKLDQEFPSMQKIIISGHGNMDSVIEAMRSGASDFIKKPFMLSEVEKAVQGALKVAEKKSNGRTISQLEQAGTGARFIGSSLQAQNIRRSLEMAAHSGCNALLLTGETGVGKEIAARYFYASRTDGSGDFIAVNCPALPDNLIESELFGHVKGAYTGADKARAGAFELADNGVLFLDEILDLSHGAQAKLLRVLETRTVSRLGEHKERPLNLVVVAASNQSLENAVRDGLFRKDLFYRLNILNVHIPPLRERKEDIKELALCFLNDYNAIVPGGSLELSEDVLSLLLEYPFPGNIRELKNILERACVLAQGDVIQPQHIILNSLQSKDYLESPIQGAQCIDVGENLAEEEKTLVGLQQAGWNKSKAARILGISYETLRWRIKKFKLKE